MITWVADGLATADPASGDTATVTTAIEIMTARHTMAANTPLLDLSTTNLPRYGSPTPTPFVRVEQRDSSEKTAGSIAAQLIARRRGGGGLTD